ncbi:MAG: mechanosensitive ion channel [Bacteroidota bacterium]|nr:mechanosensitive ion channel [Bacteroidota bacterium]
MNAQVADFLRDILTRMDLKDCMIPSVSHAIIIILIILLALVGDIITKRLIVTIITAYVKRSKNQWDDVFLEKGVFNRLSHFAPALIVFYSIHFTFNQYQAGIAFIQAMTKIYMIIISLLVADSCLEALHEIYVNHPRFKNRSIKGYIQVAKIIIDSIGIIFIISIISNKPPLTLLAGIGAMAALLVLVFKDTISGFVSGIQLSANDMVKPGDWIEIPKFNIDGVVQEIALSTVKIENWDKTISTIPTYTLVTDTFVNWKGMEQSKGRRIKRSFLIDMNTVDFCNKDLLAKFASDPYLKDFINGFSNDNKDEEPLAQDELYKITNLGLFRKYLEAYLKKHPRVNNEMTLLVRDLPATERGIPVEINFFTKNKDGYTYELFQSEIAEHVLAVIPEFGLKVFQNPSGRDIKKIHEE